MSFGPELVDDVPISQADPLGVLLVRGRRFASSRPARGRSGSFSSQHSQGEADATRVDVSWPRHHHR